MQLLCPHCRASYDIDLDIADALFVCHRCKREFTAAHPWLKLRWQPASATFAAPPWRSTEVFTPSPLPNAQHSDNTGDETASEATDETSINRAASDDHQSDTRPAPAHAHARIWPWLLVVLLTLSVSGFWLQRDAWLDNRAVRSLLLDLGAPLPLRARDWRIDPASVHARWLIRADDSRLLLIRGTIANLLDLDMPPPRIRITFYAADAPQQVAGEALLTITTPPDDTQLQQLPYIAPPTDSRPIAALSRRDFVIVSDSIPEQAGDFTLSAAPD
jgi:hypothetical protein